MDDGSKDTSGAICDEYEEVDSDSSSDDDDDEDEELILDDDEDIDSDADDFLADIFGGDD